MREIDYIIVGTRFCCLFRRILAVGPVLDKGITDEHLELIKTFPIPTFSSLHFHFDALFPQHQRAQIFQVA